MHYYSYVFLSTLKCVIFTTAKIHFVVLYYHLHIWNTQKASEEKNCEGLVGRKKKKHHRNMHNFNIIVLGHINEQHTCWFSSFLLKFSGEKKNKTIVQTSWFGDFIMKSCSLRGGGRQVSSLPGGVLLPFREGSRLYSYLLIGQYHYPETTQPTTSPCANIMCHPCGWVQVWSMSQLTFISVITHEPGGKKMAFISKYWNNFVKPPPLQSLQERQ